MTDRYFALTVALKQDMREDDAEGILAAIRMIKGVLSVEGHVADTELFTAEKRIRLEMEEALHYALQEYEAGI